MADPRSDPAPARNPPPAFAGARIGLYGGSFNPPHAGHRHVAETALRRLGLQQVWWLVTPGNPLKVPGATPPAGSRRTAVAGLVGGGAAMAVTDFEAARGFRYSVQTLRFLAARHPDVHFVWIMGADSLASLHRWRDWRQLMACFPVAVVDRPGATRAALAAPAARAVARFRVPEQAARTLPGRRAPAWCFLHGPLDASSSSALRAAAGRSLRVPLR